LKLDPVFVDFYMDGELGQQASIVEDQWTAVYTVAFSLWPSIAIARMQINVCERGRRSEESGIEGMLRL